MGFDETDIQELIRQGENASLEFKQEDVRAESIAKEIVAFANRDGGTLVLGLTDDGTVQGLSGDRNYEEWIANIARNNVIPSICTDFSLVLINGKKLHLSSSPREGQTLSDKGRQISHPCGNNKPCGHAARAFATVSGIRSLSLRPDTCPQDWDEGSEPDPAG